MELLDAEGKRIKHLRPAKYRRLKKDLHLFGVPKNCEVIVQLHYYRSSAYGEDIFADVWLRKHIGGVDTVEFFEQIQSF